MKHTNPLGLALLASVLMSAPVLAAKKDIDLNEYNDLPGVRLELVMEVREGDRVVPHAAKESAEEVQLEVDDELRFCVESSKKGYVTLWHRRAAEDGSVQVKKLYPKGTGAVAIAADKKECPASTDEHWGFVVSGPDTDAEVIAHWTPTEKDAWSNDAYPDAYPKAVKKARSAESPSADTYASRTLRYSAVVKK